MKSYSSMHALPMPSEATAALDAVAALAEWIEATYGGASDQAQKIYTFQIELDRLALSLTVPGGSRTAETIEFERGR